jgi:hypothetical protein
MVKPLLVLILALAIGAAQGAEWIVEGQVVGVSDCVFRPNVISHFGGT